MPENIKENPAPAVTVAPRSRRERKKERTRQEIYRAAMELFVVRGFDAVTVEDICQAADVAKGTFFLHFPTKDALLLEYGAQVTGELEEVLSAHRSGAISALRKMLGFLAERTLKHADIVRLVVREVMTRPTALVSATEQSRDLVYLLATVVRQGQVSGELRHRVEPRLAAGIITAAYFAIITEWVRCGGKFDLAGAVQQSLDVVFNGLADKKK
ncbi:MAG: TetR/AcrR family transcriptional regulator [Deltaproteobacteria bacterium]|nr:TetR/AcrR family transcriptional regulator [Deltaproteobacteria bacterium]